MIRSFRSKALRRYWEKADASKIRPDWLRAVKLVLSAVDAAREPRALNLPGLRYHALKGDQVGRFAVDVSGSWRITFVSDDEDAVEVDLEITMAVSISKRHPSIEPSSPGVLLAEIVIPATGKSRSEIARLLGISRMSLYAVLRGRQGVTPAMAARLGKLFGNGSAFWLAMQQAVDLWHAERDLASELETIGKSRLTVTTVE